MEDIKIARKYMAKAQSSEQRGISFELTYSDYKRLHNKTRCAYTGKKLSHEDKTWSLERMDNTIGYTKANTIVCDKELNGKKSNLTIPQLKQIIRVWERKSKNLKR